MHWSVSTQRAETNLVAEPEEAATHALRLGLWELQRGDDALRNVGDVEVCCLRAEPCSLAIGIWVQIAQQGVGVVDLPIWDSVEALKNIGWIIKKRLICPIWDFVEALKNTSKKDPPQGTLPQWTAGAAARRS
jgi:hypothetical protein